MKVKQFCLRIFFVLSLQFAGCDWNWGDDECDPGDHWCDGDDLYGCEEASNDTGSPLHRADCSYGCYEGSDVNGNDLVGCTQSESTCPDGSEAACSNLGAMLTCSVNGDMVFNVIRNEYCDGSSFCVDSNEGTVSCRESGDACPIEGQAQCSSRPASEVINTYYVTCTNGHWSEPIDCGENECVALEDGTTECK